MKLVKSEEFKAATENLIGFSAPNNGMPFPLTKSINNSTISVGGDLSVKVFRTHLAPVGSEAEILIGQLSPDVIESATELCI